MAEDTKSLPLLGARVWWSLRAKFRSAMPRQVTVTYLAAALSIDQKSARNIIPALKRIGLIDDEGKPTERANRWRNDASYPAVCEEIRKEVYPQELQDLASDSSVDRTVVQNWLATHTATGESAGRKMAGLYMTLLEANPQGDADPRPQSSGAQAKRASKKHDMPRRSKKQDEAETPPPAAALPPALVPPSLPQSVPSIHLNLQVHLSPEATLEQIDKIFESIAKHLKSA
jgi:uncharacterized protein DUF5343